jgi:nitroreductase
MRLHHASEWRKNVCKFTDQPLREKYILTILNAGRRAQSSKNTQPWHFIATTGKGTLKSLSECGEWVGHLAGAALGVTIVHPDPSEKFQVLFDIGQAASHVS